MLWCVERCHWLDGSYSWCYIFGSRRVSSGLLRFLWSYSWPVIVLHGPMSSQYRGRSLSISWRSRLSLTSISEFRVVCSMIFLSYLHSDMNLVYISDLKSECGAKPLTRRGKVSCRNRIAMWWPRREGKLVLVRFDGADHLQPVLPLRAIGGLGRFIFRHQSIIQYFKSSNFTCL